MAVLKWLILDRPAMQSTLVPSIIALTPALCGPRGFKGEQAALKALQTRADKKRKKRKLKLLRSESMQTH